VKVYDKFPRSFFYAHKNSLPFAFVSFVLIEDKCDYASDGVKKLHLNQVLLYSNAKRRDLKGNYRNS